MEAALYFQFNLPFPDGIIESSGKAGFLYDGEKDNAERTQMEIASLEDLIPRYHLVRKLDEAIDLSFIYEEVHGMSYTQYRGLAKIKMELNLLFDCMNLKKLAIWK